MDLKKLTEFIIKNLVDNPDMVSVKQLDDEDMITLIVMVSNEDMGKVIGKNGKIVNAIRTLVKASSYKNNLPKVNIEIDSF